MTRRTKKERDLIDRLARAESSEHRLREEYTRFDDALDNLMRDIAREVASDLCHPTSIAAARLIAALFKASQTIHTRS